MAAGPILEESTRELPMGAMKNLAIEAEHQQEVAGNGTAFRLGILFAVQQLNTLAQTELQGDDGMAEAAWDFYSDSTHWLFELHDYLFSLERG